jgi:hypothetical protein
MLLKPVERTTTMKISEKVKAKADQIAAEIQAGLDPGPKAQEVLDKSKAAIVNGGQSDHWKTYMQLFSDPADLAKLIPDGSAKDTERAYLVSNGMCFMGTTPTLLDNVTTALD